MVASSSSQSGLGRSASVPEPILMQNKRIPSYGTKKPEEIDTDAPGFSYKNHFKKAYLTGEADWYLAMWCKNRFGLNLFVGPPSQNRTGFEVEDCFLLILPQMKES
jgi:hypothetical protein